MADIPRLNGVIRALKAGKTAFTSFCHADPETAIAMSTAKYDGIVYEMEHNPWDIRALRDSLQYMLNRGQIARSGSVAPAVTPLVRIPPNGAEKAQFQAKQALDLGAGKHSVRCPWDAENSSVDSEQSTATVIWESSAQQWPNFCCQHDHCLERRIADVMALWADADRFCARAYRRSA